MARRILRPLLAVCLCGEARAVLRSQLAARSSQEPDDLIAMGDADMVEAERSISEHRQRRSGAMSSNAISGGAQAAAAEAAATPEPGSWEDALGTLNGAMKMAGERVRAGMSRGMKQVRDKAMGKEFGKKDLALVSVPVNFATAAERAGLNGDRMQDMSFLYKSSFEAKKEQNQWNAIRIVKGPGGEIWGQMDPDLRPISNITGCNLYHTPQKYWPEDIAERYFSGKRAFGILRDPYDKVVAVFRELATGGGQPSRKEVSDREGAPEVESEEYLAFYSDCDVNGWVKAELARVAQGDVYRGNCHLLPQAEYFDHPHGISLPIDNRLLPESFNEVMEEHGYPIRMDAASVRHTKSCGKISAWSLDEESRALVREVYASDFELLCKTFGYCDTEELTCMQQLPQMCGGSPYDASAQPGAGASAEV